MRRLGKTVPSSLWQSTRILFTPSFSFAATEAKENDGGSFTVRWCERESRRGIYDARLLIACLFALFFCRSSRRTWMGAYSGDSVLSVGGYRRCGHGHASPLSKVGTTTFLPILRLSSNKISIPILFHRGA